MKKSCACYAIWNEKIGLWEFLQKSKPNQQEAHLYEEVVILPLANRAEVMALYRDAMEVARLMRSGASGSPAQSVPLRSGSDTACL